MEKTNFNEVIKKIKNLKLNIKTLINNNKIILIKNNNFESAIISFSKTRINSESSFDILQFKKIVKCFLITLSQNCKKFSTNLFMQNFSVTNFDINVPFQNSKFISNNTLEEGESVSGLFSLKQNKISYYIENFSSSFHELLHLASSTIRNSVLISGFEVKSGKIRFGRGINEGYTQFLAKRYFKDKACDMYKLEVLVVRTLEVIVGKDKMEELYFTANPFKLIKEIEKYSNDYHSKELIVDLDDLFDNECLFNEYNEYSKEREYVIQELLNRIYLFLLKSLKRKVLLFDTSNLNSSNIQDMMFLLDKNNWINSININGHNFNLLSEDQYNLYLNFDEISTKKVS